MPSGRCRPAGALVAITVTTPDEAVLAEQVGRRRLCLQGSEAGAHRGSFTNDTGPAQDHPAGFPPRPGAGEQRPAAHRRRRSSAVRDDVAAVLAAGATQVQLGTAFLRCTESGAHPLYKAALADPRFTSTAITRAFSGRRARSLVNDFVRAHRGAPAAYPEVNNATRPLRAAAQAAGDVQRMSLYAGEGFRAAEPSRRPRSSNDSLESTSPRGAVAGDDAGRVNVRRRLRVHPTGFRPGHGLPAPSDRGRAGLDQPAPRRRRRGGRATDHGTRLVQRVQRPAAPRDHGHDHAGPAGQTGYRGRDRRPAPSDRVQGGGATGRGGRRHPPRLADPRRTTPAVVWSCGRPSARPRPTSSPGPSGPVLRCAAGI